MVLLNLFARDFAYMILTGKLKRSHFDFFAKNVARGNAVQMFSNFPAKSLSI